MFELESKRSIISPITQMLSSEHTQTHRDNLNGSFPHVSLLQQVMLSFPLSIVAGTVGRRGRDQAKSTATLFSVR